MPPKWSAPNWSPAPTPPKWSPAPVGLAHPSLFTERELDLYEKEILANSKATEHDASRFFARYPKFLCLGQGAEIRREVLLLSSPEVKPSRVDFFRRDYGSIFWDIIELKSPKAPSVVRGHARHPRLSAVVLDAINQAEDYRDTVNNDVIVQRRLKEQGIRLCRPQIMVITGRQPKVFSEETVQILLDRIRTRGVDLFSYMDVLLFAREHYEATRETVIIGRHYVYELGSEEVDVKEKRRKGEAPPGLLPRI